MTGDRRWPPLAVAVLVIALVSGLAGCGFHLQGSSPLPAGVHAMNVTYNDNYRVGDPPLVTTLRQSLRQRDLLGNGNAPAQLDVKGISNRQRVVSVSPINGGVAEYALTTTVTFDYRVNGVPRLSNQTLSVSRDYSVNDTARLATVSEQDNLRTAMQKELAHLILLRIAEVNQRLARPAAGAS